MLDVVEWHRCPLVCISLSNVRQRFGVLIYNSRMRLKLKAYTYSLVELDMFDLGKCGENVMPMQLKVIPET